MKTLSVILAAAAMILPCRAQDARPEFRPPEVRRPETDGLLAGANRLEAEGEVESNSVTLVSGPDRLITASYKSLLEDGGYIITTVPYTGLRAAVAERTRLIVLACAHIPTDSDAFIEFLLSVKNSDMPVIAVGDSARTILRQLELSMVQHATMVPESRVIPITPLHSTLKKTRPIPISSNGFDLYSKMQTGTAVMLQSVPSYLRPIVQSASRPGAYPVLLEDNRFLFWGYSGSPDIMSAQGRDLFLNLVDYLVQGKKEESGPHPHPRTEPGVNVVLPARTAANQSSTEVITQQGGMTIHSTGSYPSKPVIYESKPPAADPSKDFKSCRLYFTSQESRAGSAFYSFDAWLGIRSDQYRVVRDGSPCLRYQQEDGVLYHTPRIKISARNKAIPPQSLLTVEYYSRSAVNDDLKLEAVQQIPISGIARGKSVMVDAGDIGTYSSSLKYDGYKRKTGKEMYGIIVTLFDPGGTLLFQQTTQQQLARMASPKPKPPMIQESQR